MSDRESTDEHHDILILYPWGLELFYSNNLRLEVSNHIRYFKKYFLFCSVPTEGRDLYVLVQH